MFAKLISCPHFGSCSGCSNELFEKPAVFQEANLFFEKWGISAFQLHVGDVYGWRGRAKLAVRGSSENPQIGLFKAHSHQVVDIPFCKVHHPSINRAITAIRAFIVKEGMIPYDENTHQGELRYLQLAVEQMTGRIQLTFVYNGDSVQMSRWEKSMQGLWENHATLWHSIWLNFNTRKDNVIFGKDWRLLNGEFFLWNRYGGVEVFYHPASFAQANAEMYEKMLGEIKRNIPENAKVTEFYAGVGTIGLFISDKCSQVQCCEINPLAQSCFEASIQRLGGEASAKMSFYSIAAAQGIDLIEESDTIIVNPPRKGMDLSLLKALQKVKTVKQLIYVSCGWKSFQRDCEELCSKGWVLKEAGAYLFFPGSDHIELLGIFQHKS